VLATYNSSSDLASKVNNKAIRTCSRIKFLILAVDKLEQMLGSYGPSATGEPYIKNFDSEESPSGMMARTGSYNVKSRVVDDDGEVYAGLRQLSSHTPIC